MNGPRYNMYIFDTQYARIAFLELQVAHILVIHGTAVLSEINIFLKIKLEWIDY